MAPPPPPAPHFSTCPQRRAGQRPAWSPSSPGPRRSLSLSPAASPLPLPPPRGCSEIPAGHPRGRALTGRARGGTEGLGLGLGLVPPSPHSGPPPPGGGVRSRAGVPEALRPAGPPRPRFPPPLPGRCMPRPAASVSLANKDPAEGKLRKQQRRPPASVRGRRPGGPGWERAGWAEEGRARGHGGRGQAAVRAGLGSPCPWERGRPLGRREDSERPAAGAWPRGRRDPPRKERAERESREVTSGLNRKWRPGGRV